MCSVLHFAFSAWYLNAQPCLNNNDNIFFFYTYRVLQDQSATINIMRKWYASDVFEMQKSFLYSIKNNAADMKLYLFATFLHNNKNCIEFPNRNGERIKDNIVGNGELVHWKWIFERVTRKWAGKSIILCGDCFRSHRIRRIKYTTRKILTPLIDYTHATNCIHVLGSNASTICRVYWWYSVRIRCKQNDWNERFDVCIRYVPARDEDCGLYSMYFHCL